MKKFFRATLLTAAIAALLCVAALAADTDSVTAAGFYNIGAADGVTITPTAATGSVEKCNADVDKDGTYETFYANSDKVTVDVSGLTANENYLVLLVEGDGTSITDSSIKYIDQIKAEGTTGIFDVYPILPTKTTDMTLIITGSGGYDRKNIPLSYTTSGTFAKQPYVLGDVDGENGLNSYDASLILQNLVGTYEFVGNGKLAADVDGENGVNSYDASLILQHLVGTYTIPGWGNN